MTDYRWLKFDDYRSIIRSEISKGSLREFARTTGVSPSRLSEVLNFKGNLSRRNGLRIADNLGFSLVEKEFFILLIAAEASRSKVDRDNNKLRAQKLRD